MAGFLEKKQWILTLTLGIIGLVVGISIVAYSIFVTNTGPFPPAGYLFIGLGLGYMICSDTVRKLEKAIQGLKENTAKPNSS